MAGRPSVRLVLALASAGLATGCIEPLGGSNIQIFFHEEVPASARPGETPRPDQPPANTHFVLYATDYVYEDADDDGKPDVDDDGQRVVKEAWVFEVQQFVIRPVIDLDSPCFIELPKGDDRGIQFPGLHSTKFEEKVKAYYQIPDPFVEGLDPRKVQEILTAQRRMFVQPLIAADLKAIASFEPRPYPAIDPAGSCDQAIPPPSCIDDDSNARRLAACQAIWAQHPGYYEGSDKVFLLPLNGEFYGTVEGVNPANGGSIGGSQIYVDDDLSGADDFFINWKYDDDAMNAARPQGTPFMQGRRRDVARGVISAKLENLDDSRIGADLTVFPNLGQDDLHF